MLKPSTSPHKHHHQKQQLPTRFSLLLWNVHKENQTVSFAHHFQKILQQYPTDILLFQEVLYPKTTPFFFENYAYSLAANMETNKNIFGVCTATQTSFTSHKKTLSRKKELGFISHKSFLVTHHLLADNSELTLVNLHAVNFVSNKSFAHELLHIRESLMQIEGPLIVAGDFNNWNNKRTLILQDFAKELRLHKLSMQNKKHVKQIFRQEIDHIFYRGIQPLQAVALNVQNISDHNPLFAIFEVQN